MKKCTKCEVVYTDEYNFCPKCGKELLNKMNQVELFNLIYPEYRKTFGAWHIDIVTDYDEMHSLGDFIGHIDEIALNLANKYNSTLYVTKITDVELDNSITEAEISFESEIFSASVNNDELASAMKQFFKDRPVEIKRNEYYKTFTIKKV